MRNSVHIAWNFRCYKSNRQLNSRSAAYSSFKYKKEKSYLLKTIYDKSY